MSFQRARPQKQNRVDSYSQQEETQQHTEEALRELFQHVHNLPDSAKKKQLIRQVLECRDIGGLQESSENTTQSHIEVSLSLGTSFGSAKNQARLWNCSVFLSFWREV